MSYQPYQDAWGIFGGQPQADLSLSNGTIYDLGLSAPLLTSSQKQAPTITGDTANSEAKKNILGSLATFFDGAIERAPAYLGAWAVEQVNNATQQQTIDAYDSPNGNGIGGPAGTNHTRQSAGGWGNKLLWIGAGVVGVAGLFMVMD